MGLEPGPCRYGTNLGSGPLWGARYRLPLERVEGAQPFDELACGRGIERFRRRAWRSLRVAPIDLGGKAIAEHQALAFIFAFADLAFVDLLRAGQPGGLGKADQVHRGIGALPVGRYDARSGAALDFSHALELAAAATLPALFANAAHLLARRLDRGRVRRLRAAALRQHGAGKRGRRRRAAPRPKWPPANLPSRQRHWRPLLPLPRRWEHRAGTKVWPGTARNPPPTESVAEEARNSRAVRPHALTPRSSR